MDILSSAHTWFFDSLNFDVEGNLNVELVEGIKSNEKEIVEVDENTTLDPYHPVNVSGNKRNTHEHQGKRSTSYNGNCWRP